MSKDTTTSDAAVKEQWDNASNKQKKVHHLQTEATFEMVSSIYDWMKSEKAKLSELGGRRSLVIGALLIGTTFFATKYYHENFSHSQTVSNLENELSTIHSAMATQSYINRTNAKAYRAKRDEVEGGFRDQIDKLNNNEANLLDQIGKEQKQKLAIRRELKSAHDTIDKKDNLIENLTRGKAAERMLAEAYQTIAMNTSPLNLQQYLSMASDEQWIGYTKMATERNAFNVVKVIASIPELMKIKEVSQMVCDYQAGRTDSFAQAKIKWMQKRSNKKP